MRQTEYGISLQLPIHNQPLTERKMAESIIKKDVEIDVTTGTLAATVGNFSDSASYPTGYTASNCHVINLEVNYSGGWRSGQGLASANGKRLFSYQQSSGVSIFNDDAALVSCQFRVTLSKI